jgi:uncharacterized DUF497 family protein
MLYEWDEAKRAANLHKHGLDFADADLVLESEYDLVVDSPRHVKIANRPSRMCSTFWPC